MSSFTPRIVQEGEEERRFAQGVRVAEALLFASPEPLAEAALARLMPGGVEIAAVLGELERLYRPRGVNLVRVAGQWMFRTAPDLGHLLKKEDAPEPKKLGRAALEVLAIIAYHQPVTRTEVEQIRGVQMNKGMLDMLLEAGFVRMRGRRRTPGRPVAFGTTEAFLIAFGLDRITDLPNLEEIVASGLAEGPVPPGLALPLPSDIPGSGTDEDPLEDDVFELMQEERLSALANEAPLDPEEGEKPPTGTEPAPTGDENGG